MIPSFVSVGGPWKVLPPGVHVATIEEIRTRFAITPYRQHLFFGFLRAIHSLSKAGCKIVFLDGSFITAKPIPEDYDVCWDPSGVDGCKLDPVFLVFSNARKEQKRQYYGEFFPSNCLADSTNNFFTFFQIDKYTGNNKGIIKINI